MLESIAAVEAVVAIRGSFRFRVLDDSLSPMAWRGWHVVCRREDPADGELAVVDANSEGPERLVLRSVHRRASGWILRDPLAKAPEIQLAGRPRRVWRFIGTCTLDMESV